MLSLRYPYVDPAVAFNNVWSFQVLIAALLGGPARPWGPAVGAVPLILLSDYLAGTFPHHFGIALGLCFVVIVYFLPGGIAPLAERLYAVRWRMRARERREHTDGGLRRQSFSVSAACARRSAGSSPCAISPSTSRKGRSSA